MINSDEAPQGVEWIDIGPVTIVNEDDLESRFARFPEGPNAYSGEKQHYAGQHAHVIVTHHDFTASVEMEDGEVHEFPMEALTEGRTIGFIQGELDTAREDAQWADDEYNYVNEAFQAINEDLRRKQE